MKQFIACVLLGVLLGIIPPLVPAQQNQNSKHTTQEIQALKNRVSELEKQLQSVENLEKMELQVKLTEANAKLVNAEFGKFERELKGSNDEWLGKWSDRFVGIIVGIIVVAVTILSTVGGVFWFWLRSTSDRLIADEVEKSLNGFKDSLKELGILKNQLRILEREHAASTLENIIHSIFSDEYPHPEQIKALREEALLAVFADEKYLLSVRYRAAEVLAIGKKSPRLVFPVLEFLNSVVDSDLEIDLETKRQLKSLASLLSYIYTEENCEGLAKFLNRLLTENPQNKQLFLTEIVFSLALVSLRLNLGTSVSMLRLAIPQLDVGQHNQQALMNLARQFDIFNEPEGIKEMLTTHGQSLPTDVVERCLHLLQKHDPEFVRDWRAGEATDNTQS